MVSEMVRWQMGDSDGKFTCYFCRKKVDVTWKCCEGNEVRPACEACYLDIEKNKPQRPQQVSGATNNQPSAPTFGFKGLLEALSKETAMRHIDWRLIEPNHLRPKKNVYRTTYKGVELELSEYAVTFRWTEVFSNGQGPRHQFTYEVQYGLSLYTLVNNMFDQEMSRKLWGVMNKEA